MLNGIQQNLTGSKISTSSTKFVFFESIGKQDGHPGLWLDETFSNSRLKPLNRIQRNYTGSKISTSSTKFVSLWFRTDRKHKMAALASMKLDRKQDLNILHQVCVFRADRKNKIAALISVWLRHFRLLLWNLWTEFNETGQEAGSQHPLLSLCFWGRTEKQDDRPCLWLAETFPTSLKPLNGIQRYLTGSRISISSTKFVFFRQNCSPCRSVKKVTHCTQVHDMWRFGPRVYYMSMLGRKLFPFFQTEPVQVPNNCILVFIVKSQPWFRSRTLYIVVSIFVDRLFRVPIFLLCIGLSIMSLYRRAMITISCYRGPLFLIHTANPTLVQILIFEKLPNPQVFSYFWIAYCIMFCLCFFSFSFPICFWCTALPM